jgi:hypothetical protein
MTSLCILLDFGDDMKIPLIRVLLLVSALTSSGAYCQTEKESKPKTSQEQEIPKSISESIAGTLQYAEGSLLGLVEAMPEERFSFIPAGGNFEGVRSFGEQIKHVACAQFAFFTNLRAKSLPMIARGADTTLRRQKSNFSNTCRIRSITATVSLLR